VLVTGKGGVVQLLAPHTCRVRDPSSSQVVVLTTTLLISVGIEAGRMPGTAVMFSTLGV